MAVKLQRIPVLVVVILGLAMGGCTLQKSEGRDDGFEPRPGTVEAMEPFHDFLDTRPTPEEFRRVYPDVTLVLPGDIATHEYRTDNSRFFAELDDDGRIIDGEFR